MPGWSASNQRRGFLILRLRRYRTPVRHARCDPTRSNHWRMRPQQRCIRTPSTPIHRHAVRATTVAYDVRLMHLDRESSRHSIDCSLLLSAFV